MEAANPAAGEQSSSVADVESNMGQIPRRYPLRNRVSAVQNLNSACESNKSPVSKIRLSDNVGSIPVQLNLNSGCESNKSPVSKIRTSENVGNSPIQKRREIEEGEEGNKLLKKGNGEVGEVVTSLGEGKEVVTRRMVKISLSMYQTIYRKLLKQEESKLNQPGYGSKIVLRAYSLYLEKIVGVLDQKKYFANVPGIEVGDEFHFRTELCLTNLHCPIRAPIDSTSVDGTEVAISIVSCSSYANYLKSPNLLVYNSTKVPSNQLRHATLPLKNNIYTRKPVRVIRGIQLGPDKVVTYVYDGLFSVQNYKRQKMDDGSYIFLFELKRVPGQPQLSIKRVDLRSSRGLPGLRIEDISGGKEKIPIPVVNTLDDELPKRFKYTTKIIHPRNYEPTLPKGCNCADGCSDSDRCACAVKNGGEIPFNHNGALVKAKPLVYECGPSCKCPPYCHSRVSQKGVNLPLEIFKTESMGWGVRCLTSIPSGTFVVHYTGELLEDEEAQKRSSDQYLFAIGNNYYDESLWKGLKTLIPDLLKNNGSDFVEDGGYFTVDASQYGNVCRFINHSCSPNLYAQNLLYDHDDKSKPHIVLFATENIPPLTELSYDYNYAIGSVHDCNGNIRKKECLCGSEDCTGRLY